MLDTDKITGRNTVAEDANRRITSADFPLKRVKWLAFVLSSAPSFITSFITPPENYRAEIFEQAR